MAAPGSVVLFVGGDPYLAGELARQPQTVGGFARMFLPAALATRFSEPLAQGDSGEAWPLPADQVMVAERLVKLADRAHRTVRLVDVNRPGPDRGLVERYVEATDVLPIALRSDGARLVGTEAFSESAIRRFLSAP